ncbi:MAG: hypothetical protein Q8O82_06525 [Pseudorhodobacter sp.]|nr:hypothetical protein [Pseudorhodobacter sp.]
MTADELPRADCRPGFLILLDLDKRPLFLIMSSVIGGAFGSGPRRFSRTGGVHRLDISNQTLTGKRR